MIQKWGTVPASFLSQLATTGHTYAFVGTEDFTMYPVIMPGTFLQVDEGRTEVINEGWRSEYERPIYFVELRDGYACSWCELQEGHLLLLPHPLSPRGVRRLAHGTEAEIVGQVTAVAMTLAPLAPARDAAARLPKQV